MDGVKWRSIRNAWLVSNEPPNHLSPWPHSAAQIDGVGQQQSATTLSDSNIPAFSYPKFISLRGTSNHCCQRFLDSSECDMSPLKYIYIFFPPLTFVSLHCHFVSAVSHMSNPGIFVCLFFCSEGFLFKGSGDLIELSVRFLSSVTFIRCFWETKIDKC